MWVVTVQNPEGQQVYQTHLKPGRPLTIGRASACNIMLGVLTVSRNHGRIELRHGRPMYFDDESSNGSRVDGQFIRGPTPLGENNILEIGGNSITVRWTGEAPPEVPVSRAPQPERVEKAITRPAPDRLEQLLDQRIAGIRRHRDDDLEGRKAREAAFGKEWKEMLDSARRLKQKLAGDSRVQDFTITREEDEINVKVTDSSARGYSFFIVARRHPEGKHPGFEAAWLLETGRPETFFEMPGQAMEELVQRLAPRLA